MRDIWAISAPFRHGPPNSHVGPQVGQSPSVGESARGRKDFQNAAAAATTTKRRRFWQNICLRHNGLVELPHQCTQCSQVRNVVRPSFVVVVTILGTSLVPVFGLCLSPRGAATATQSSAYSMCRNGCLQIEYVRGFYSQTPPSSSSSSADGQMCFTLQSHWPREFKNKFRFQGRERSKCAFRTEFASSGNPPRSLARPSIVTCRQWVLSVCSLMIVTGCVSSSSSSACAKCF